MMQTTNSLVVNKLISIENSINGVGSQKVIIEANSKEFGTEYFISRARLAFVELKQAFSTVPILHHFDPKYHIQIKINRLGYTIGVILRRLNSDNLEWWHLVAFFFQKIILVKTPYKTYNSELSAIVKE